MIEQSSGARDWLFVLTNQHPLDLSFTTNQGFAKILKSKDNVASQRYKSCRHIFLEQSARRWPMAKSHSLCGDAQK